MRELRATLWKFWMGSGRSVRACPRRGRGSGREEWHGGAPVPERRRRLVGQLRGDAVELKAGPVQAERPWRGGATVSSSSPAFGRRWRRRSEAWEWRKKRRMRPTARWGGGSTQARANTGARHSIWSSPRRRLGGGRAAVVRAWRVQEMPGREGSRSGEGKDDAWILAEAGGGT
jgi:hypothetical protein